MLLAFLQGELTSERFSDDLLAALEVSHAEPSLILDGDLKNDAENALRREVMGAFRGYGRDEELFHHFRNTLHGILRSLNRRICTISAISTIPTGMRSPEIRLYRLTLFRQSVKTAAFLMYRTIGF